MKLLKDERGVTAVEFALIALPLFLIIMGGLEMGIRLFNQAQVEWTLREAARMAVTGDVSRNGTDGSKIDEYVKKSLAFTGDTKVDITKSFYDKFDQVGNPEKKDRNTNVAPYCFEDINGNERWDANPRREGLGGADDIINYSVRVEYPAYFPLVTNVATGKKDIVLYSETTLRNEPFAGNNDQQVRNCCVSASPGNPVTCS